MHDMVTYRSSENGMTRSGPETRKTKPLIRFSVREKMKLCTSGPRKPNTACALCVSAYTAPAV